MTEELDESMSLILDETFFNAKRYVDYLLSTNIDLEKLSPSDEYIIHIDQTINQRPKYYKFTIESTIDIKQILQKDKIVYYGHSCVKGRKEPMELAEHFFKLYLNRNNITNTFIFPRNKLKIEIIKESLYMELKNA